MASRSGSGKGRKEERESGGSGGLRGEGARHGQYKLVLFEQDYERGERATERPNRELAA